MGKIIGIMTSVSLVLSSIGVIILAYFLGRDSYGDVQPIFFLLILLCLGFVTVFLHILLYAFGDFIDDVSIIRRKVEVFSEKEGINEFEKILEEKYDDPYEKNQELIDAEEAVKKISKQDHHN